MPKSSSRLKPFLASLRKALPRDAVLSDPGTLAANAGDKWFASSPPDCVVMPSSTAEVSAAVRRAARFRVPITGRGAGYGYVGGCVPMAGGMVLNLSRMRRILEIDKADGIARVEAGVITRELQQRVKKLGLFYPPDPASLSHSTLGGNIATNAGGPRCLKYGVTRNYVLGLTVVMPDGKVVRTGGRTIKNKVGFDFTSLFTGSEGLLGIITEATLRLLPLPPARAILSCPFSTLPAAAKAVQAIFSAGFTPAAIEIADSFTLEAARRHVGTTLVPQGRSHLLVEIDGQPASVQSEVEALQVILNKCGALSMAVGRTPQECDRLWGLRRAFSESLKATGLTKLNEDITVPRGRLVDLMRFAAGLQQRHGFPVACFGHAGDGNIHVNIMAADYDKPDVKKRVEKALDELFDKIIAWDGAITGEHGIGLAKQRWWSEAVAPELAGLHHLVKQALDPNGLMNPGKFLG